MLRPLNMGNIGPSEGSKAARSCRFVAKQIGIQAERHNNSMAIGALAKP
jgi:hypothetical protein